MNKLLWIPLLGAGAFLSYFLFNIQNFASLSVPSTPEGGFLVIVGSFLVITVMCLVAGLLIAMKS
jgi:hypothetical protein